MSIGILGRGGSVIGTLLAEFMNSVSRKLLLGLMLLQPIRNTLGVEIWGFSVFRNLGVFSDSGISVSSVMESHIF